MMKPLPFEDLLSWILKEYETRQSVFGVHRSLFHIPRADPPYATPAIFGSRLGTPIGPAAGPHTQLAQNIVSAWLSGGRFIELKTVQIMDELEIPRPCIDMEDEGYNVEWSQELKLGESIEEYVKAWVLVHILPQVLGFGDEVTFDTIFNMSVGYNLEGIQGPAMTHFMDAMEDASEPIARIQGILRQPFPRFAEIEIRPRIANSVTLSTMHGCPPDEIERIARYLIEQRHLHTTVKLNPTLLGRGRVTDILHGSLGFSEMEIPDSAFEHDLKYDRAVSLVTSLKQSAAREQLTFGVKLSNTLAMKNHKTTLPGDEMYMSGRALYPLTINLFSQLAHEFGGELNVSYSAGADALNVTDILACGALPVTVASDLLKPGGYSRCLQYLENLESAMKERGAASLDDLARDKLEHLSRMAADALRDRRYKKDYHQPDLPKTPKPLGMFDCIAAPCVARCPVHQDVPEYAWLIAHGEYDRALQVVLARNPLPGITGYVCTHTCETRCTRTNYEEPVAIRALKRVAFEKGHFELRGRAPNGHKVAVIGAGPSGLAAAACLALNGVKVTIFEAKDRAGGMIDIAPEFRLPRSVIKEDVDRIVGLGVEILFSHPITGPPENLLQQGFEAVYVATGFPKDASLDIEGVEGDGVYTALDLLGRITGGERPALGPKVLVIGGGNTAVDAARTAGRLAGRPVTLVYRRTLHEMPADAEEREDLLAEGHTIEELVSPVRVIRTDGRVVALECVRNRLGSPDADGRRRPVPVEGSEFRIDADAIVIAIGQSPDLAFLRDGGMVVRRDGAVEIDARTGHAGRRRVYAGGDAVRGPATIIEACADGRRSAEAICSELGIEIEPPSFPAVSLSEEDIAAVKRMRARKEMRSHSQALAPSKRSAFDLVEQTLTDSTACAEALRCLQCSTFCDKCVEVCPNRANLTAFVPVQNLVVPRFACSKGQLSVTGHDTLRISQSRQIIHMEDLCNECGNCATFCVHEGRPYADKPRIYLGGSRHAAGVRHPETMQTPNASPIRCPWSSDYEQQDDNAFLVRKDGEPGGSGWTIRRRSRGKETRLTVMAGAGEATFETPWLRGRITLPEFQIHQSELTQAFEGECSLLELAEMYVVLQAVTGSLAFLPLA